MLRTRRFSVSILCSMGCLFLPAWAVPPEVTGDRFLSSQVLDWGPASGAVGYHVYRSTVADLRSGDYGDCLLGSVRGTSASDAANPPAGVAFTYLVAAFDESGQGSLGSTSGGSPRNPVMACIPARRIFHFGKNGDPGDGVEDGKEPPRNPSAIVRATSREVTGVYLHSGEFFVAAADVWSVDRVKVEGNTAPISHGETVSERLGSSDETGVVVFGGPGDILSYYQDRVGNEAFLDTATQRRSVRQHGSIVRQYRSQVAYAGPLGHNWDFAANARLEFLGAYVLHFDGTGRCDPFLRVGMSTDFTSPAGVYSVLKQNPDGSYTLRSPHGTKHTFHAFDGSNRAGAVEKVEDRDGNRVSFLYDHQGLLTTVVDTLGRAIAYVYDAEGRITSITDFAGRSVVYGYDANGDLVSVRSPIVTGTPNGNDFPSGKTTTYTYSSGFSDARLNHDLLTIRSPNEYPSGPPAVQVAYVNTGTAFDLDRVVSQTIGGTNASGVPAGGTITYTLSSVNSGSDPNDLTIPRRQMIVIDRDGNQKEFVHNIRGNRLWGIEYTNRNLRPGEPDYVTSSSFNADGDVTEVTFPEGNQILFTYDRPGADRYREGNVLQVEFDADPLILGGRGNGHGAEASPRLWTYTYEPVFNQVATATEPRGNDAGWVPQNGGPNSPERFRTSYTYDYQEGDPATNGINALATQFGIVLGSTSFQLGDVNGDGSVAQASGNAVKVAAPTVNLLSGSNQAVIQGDTTQEIETKLQYNSLGQLTVVLDAEGNRHEYQYYPESDPDGDGASTPTPPDGRILDTSMGGYPKTRLLDTSSGTGRNNGTNPPPVNLREDYAYDDVGNLTDLIDGRGVRTRWVVNALNQVVELRRAAATAEVTGPDGDLATGRGELGLAPVSYKIRYAYDANDNPLRVEIEDRDLEVGVGLSVDVSGTVDICDNMVKLDHEVDVDTTLSIDLTYDANENTIRMTMPEGNSDETSYDERGFILSTNRGVAGPRGGTPSIRAYEYHGNGRLKRVTDGRGGLVDYSYDGFDRLTKTIDQVGNTSELFYDPASNRIRNLRRGPVGGPTPTDRSGSTNVDLSNVRFRYDELSRLFRKNESLFVPSGVTPARTPILSEGPHVPGDGFINTDYEHDRLSRRTFAVEDSDATTRFDYDGLGRMLKATHPGSAGQIEWTYDANHNAVEVAETENSSTGSLPAPELFLTTHFYDALNRRDMSVDPMGHTWRRVWNSLDEVTTTTDPNGPPGGTILRRSPGHETMSVPINGHGNVSLYAYDGLGRRLTSTRVLTATGLGDGTTSPPPDTSNPNNPDGLVTLVTAWDDDSLVAESQDDKGNSIAYAYDNLNRPVTRTADDGTTEQYGYDAEDNVVSRTDPNGTVVTSTFDAAERPVSVSVSRATGVEGTTLQTFEYDGLSRLTRATDNNNPGSLADNATATFLYDSLSRSIEEGQQISDGTPTRTSDWGWLAESLNTDLIYPSGRQVQYFYDAADRLASLTDPGGSGSAAYQYFGPQRVHTRLFASGLRSTHLDDAGTLDIGFDPARRTTIWRHLGSGSVLLAGFEYRYDAASNRTSHRRFHHALGPGLFKGEKYAYDSANRLISFQEGTLNGSHVLTSPTDQETWSMDGVANWASFTRNGTQYLDTPNNNNEYDDMQSGGTRVDDGVPDDFHDLASTPTIPDGLNLTHDKNGSQTNIGQFQIKYDFRNRPVRATRNSDSLQVATYAYDALGRRVKRTVTNSGSLNETLRFYYARSLPVEERNASDAVFRQVVFGLGGERLWQIRSPAGTPLPSEYLLEDALGSTVALATGSSVAERITYDPYGRPTFETPSNTPILDVSGNFLARSNNGNPDLFLGMRYDPELGTRTNNVNTDLGGLYLARVGNHVGPPESPLAWVGNIIGPPDSPLEWVGSIIGPPDSPLAWVLTHVGPPASPLAWAGTIVGPPESPLAWVGNIIGPPESPLGWSMGASSPTVHIAWADNRDVRPPPDGDWAMYNPNQGRSVTRVEADMEAGSVQFGDGRRGSVPPSGNSYVLTASNPVSGTALDWLKVQPQPEPPLPSPSSSVPVEDAVLPGRVRLSTSGQRLRLFSRDLARARGGAVYAGAFDSAYHKNEDLFIKGETTFHKLDAVFHKLDAAFHKIESLFIKWY